MDENLDSQENAKISIINGYVFMLTNQQMFEEELKNASSRYHGL